MTEKGANVAAPSLAPTERVIRVRRRGHGPATVISFANQKGGVAKTTSTLNLAVALREKRLRVLAVDIDPQGNLTMSQGFNPDAITRSMFDVLVHRLPIEHVVHQAEIDIAVSSIDLAGAELAMARRSGASGRSRRRSRRQGRLRLHPHRHAAVARAA